MSAEAVTQMFAARNERSRLAMAQAFAKIDALKATPSIWREPVKRDTRTNAEVMSSIVDQMIRLNQINAKFR